jgi:hypothetical protein
MSEWRRWLPQDTEDWLLISIAALSAVWLVVLVTQRIGAG